MIDYSHLDALNLNLSNERSRLANAKSAQEKELRTVWIAQLEKEIAAEQAFLGVVAVDNGIASDDDLLAELGL